MENASQFFVPKEFLDLFFRHMKQLIIFCIYFLLMFVCFLDRPTPRERSSNNRTLICIANFHTFNYSNMNTKDQVNRLKLFSNKIY